MQAGFGTLHLLSSRFPETQSKTHPSIHVEDPWDYLTEQFSFFLHNVTRNPAEVASSRSWKSFKPKGSLKLLFDVLPWHQLTGAPRRNLLGSVTSQVETRWTKKHTVIWGIFKGYCPKRYTNKSMDSANLINPLATQRNFYHLLPRSLAGRHMWRRGRKKKSASTICLF